MKRERKGEEVGLVEREGGQVKKTGGRERGRRT